MIRNVTIYYSIIPATVRYDTKLKASEKLIYGEITSLANRMGYCFAQNRYFANLYKVSTHTVSQWISHLEKQGYIHTEVMNNKYIIPTKFYLILERLKLIYSKEILSIMPKDKIQMVKEVIYVLYELYNSKFISILSQVSADSLFNLYLIAQEHKPIDFFSYYKRSVINKYTYNST